MGAYCRQHLTTHHTNHISHHPYLTVGMLRLEVSTSRPGRPQDSRTPSHLAIHRAIRGRLAGKRKTSRHDEGVAVRGGGVLSPGPEV